MSKSSIPSSHATRKISRNKSKKQSSIFIDSESSDNFFHPASVASSRGLKDLPFESPVISHIMATTLLPRADSHSMLTLHDTFSVYCLISCIKYRSSSATTLVPSKAWASFTLVPHGFLKLTVKAWAIRMRRVDDVMTKLAANGEQVDSLKDLLLAAHHKTDNVKDVSNKTSVDVDDIH
uniref:Uncharacterized protein n=2 Tax=Solanum lycopersicum TaxID=4081 RepID=K4C4L2_SOLLC